MGEWQEDGQVMSQVDLLQMGSALYSECRRTRPRRASNRGRSSMSRSPTRSWSCSSTTSVPDDARVGPEVERVLRLPVERRADECTT